MSSRCSRSVRTHLPHVGQPNHDHEPPFGNLRKWTLTFFSTWPSWTRNVVVSAVMMSSARRREIETLGRSSCIGPLPRTNWVNRGRRLGQIRADAL